MANVQLQQLLRFNLCYWLGLATLDFALMLLWWLLMPDYKFELTYTASKVVMVVLEIAVSTWFIRWSFARQLPPVQVCAAAALIFQGDA